MRNYRTLILLILIAAAIILSGCSGGALANNSWPGMTVDGDTAYVAFNNFIYAVNVENGTERWRFPQAEGDVERNTSFFAAPTLGDDGSLVVGDYNQNLRLLDAETGNQLADNWPFTQAENLYVGSSLTVGNEIFAPNSDGNLYALSDSGTSLWDPFETGQALWSQPVTDDETIYFTSLDHNLYAVDINTGNKIWEIDLGGAAVGSPALSEDGTLYIGSFDKQMLAIDSATGRLEWEFPTQAGIWSGPTLFKDGLYFGDMDGNFYAVDRASGSQEWTYSASGPIVGSPLVTEDTIYIPVENGNLVALGFDGNQKWTNSPIEGSNLYSAPAETEELILVASLGTDELIIAYTPEGVQRWTFIPSEN